MPRRRKLSELPVRTSRFKHTCCVCLDDITTSQRYHDGGYFRRSHIWCAIKAENDHSIVKSKEEINEAIRLKYDAIAKQVYAKHDAKHST